MDEIEYRIKTANREFYDLLETETKRYRPLDFGPTIVDFMRRYIGKGKFAWAPPHQVALALEANCAFTRGNRSEVLTQSRYARLMNVFHNNEDRGLAEVIKKNLGNFFLILHRQQIELQRGYCARDLARYLRLYVVGDPLPVISEWFLSHHGLSLEDWVKCGVVLFALSEKNTGRLIKIDNRFPGPQINLPNKSMRAYLDLASKSPIQIGERFKKLRADINPKYHSLIRSVFFESPIVRYDEANLLVPFPALAFHYAGDGLYELIRNAEAFDKEFGDDVENYVRLILNEMSNAIVLEASTLEKLATDKSCDFIIQTSTEILLVEAKATTFRRNIITEETIRDDGSTRAVSRAIIQLYKTAYDLSRGCFDSLGVTADKPIYLIVATFGDIAFANAPWYFGEYILKGIEHKLKPPYYPNKRVQHQPIVLSLQDLELLVILLAHEKTTVAKLVQERIEQPFGLTGDWDTFLSNKTSELGAKKLQMHFVKEAGGRFFESLGIRPSEYQAE